MSVQSFYRRAIEAASRRASRNLHVRTYWLRGSSTIELLIRVSFPKLKSGFPHLVSAVKYHPSGVTLYSLPKIYHDVELTSAKQILNFELIFGFGEGWPMTMVRKSDVRLMRVCEPWVRTVAASRMCSGWRFVGSIVRYYACTCLWRFSFGFKPLMRVRVALSSNVESLANTGTLTPQGLGFCRSAFLTF